MSLRRAARSDGARTTIPGLTVHRVERQELWGRALIAHVGGPQLPEERTLLEVHSDHDVNAHSEREHEVARRHVRCGPKADEQRKHHWMTHVTVEHGRHEALARVARAPEAMEGLLQAEQIEVVDH